MLRDDELIVYHYDGESDEMAPSNVRKLVMTPDVDFLPGGFCEGAYMMQEVELSDNLKSIGPKTFYCCALRSIEVSRGVKVIGQEAFLSCGDLAEVIFDMPSKLERIEKLAFIFCESLERLTIPPSIYFLGESVLDSCRSLVEVVLLSTPESQLKELPERCFSMCFSLQTVRLPNSMMRIKRYAFQKCTSLVTVEMALDHSICIEELAFVDCTCLANMELPPNSVVEKEAFKGYAKLQQMLGEQQSDVVQGLIQRFEKRPVHKMCYHASTTSASELRQQIYDGVGTDDRHDLQDQFGMTPFHLLLSSPKPRQDLFEVLLDAYPYCNLSRKDCNGKLPIDYLISNWNEDKKLLLQMAFQFWIFGRLKPWYVPGWRGDMLTRINELLNEERKDRRRTLWNELRTLMDSYERQESIALLEMALWKKKVANGSDDARSVIKSSVDRKHCQNICGSEVVNPLVIALLGFGTD